MFSCKLNSVSVAPFLYIPIMALSFSFDNTLPQVTTLLYTLLCVLMVVCWGRSAVHWSIFNTALFIPYNALHFYTSMICFFCVNCDSTHFDYLVHAHSVYSNLFSTVYHFQGSWFLFSKPACFVDESVWTAGARWHLFHGQLAGVVPLLQRPFRNQPPQSFGGNASLGLGRVSVLPQRAGFLFDRPLV